MSVQDSALTAAPENTVRLGAAAQQPLWPEPEALAVQNSWSVGGAMDRRPSTC